MKTPFSTICVGIWSWKFLQAILFSESWKRWELRTCKKRLDVLCLWWVYHYYHCNRFSNKGYTTLPRSLRCVLESSSYLVPYTAMKWKQVQIAFTIFSWSTAHVDLWKKYWGWWVDLSSLRYTKLVRNVATLYYSSTELLAFHIISCGRQVFTSTYLTADLLYLLYLQYCVTIQENQFDPLLILIFMTVNPILPDFAVLGHHKDALFLLQKILCFPFWLTNQFYLCLSHVCSHLLPEIIFFCDGNPAQKLSQNDSIISDWIWKTVRGNCMNVISFSTKNSMRGWIKLWIPTSLRAIWMKLFSMLW